MNAWLAVGRHLCKLLLDPIAANWVLVAVGVWGVWAALRTLGVIKRQTKITEDTLVLTQRPRIYVRNFYFSELKGTGAAYYVPNGITNASVCSGQFYIVNSGGTPAYIKEIYCEAYTAKFLPMRRPYEGKIGDQGTKKLLPGQSITWLFALTEPLDSLSVRSIADNKTGFYVLGWIGYTDDLGIYRITAFCREYSVTSNRFMPVDNSDYENYD
jgi:hypothetical protein